MTKPKFLFYLFVCFLLQSCYPWWEPTEPEWESQYEPVAITRAELDKAIELKSPQEIVNSGKIYVKDDLLFIGEEGKGFHVFDNSDVLNPVKSGFISVLACTDIAMRNNVLFINQATDLITLRFNAEEKSLALVKRVKNTFPELRSPEGERAYDVENNSVVIDWKLINLEK